MDRLGFGSGEKAKGMDGWVGVCLCLLLLLLRGLVKA